MAPRALSYADELGQIAPLVKARANGICEVCKAARIEHLHHRLRRSQGGRNTMDHVLGVCHSCHTWIHANPAQSYEAGYLIRRGS